MYSTQLYFQSNRYHVIFTIVWNNEECIIFSVIDILCFDEDSSTFKKKSTTPHTFDFQSLYLANGIRS